MENVKYRILENRTAYGTLGLDGKLGYSDDADVFVPPEYRDWSCLSAHGPSSIRLELGQDAEILGILDGSTYRLDHDNLVRYFVNGWKLGRTIGPWDATRSIVIPPGEHSLEIAVDGDASHGHSLWLLRGVDKETADAENTVIFTVDTRGRKSSYSKLFRETAEKHGVPVEFLDEGKPWKGFYRHKIEAMIPRLRRRREEGKRFAFILDARDVVFIDPYPLMLAKFNAINDGRLIFNTDGLGALYPCGQEWIKAEYRKIVGHFQGFLNAGVLIGDIDVFLKIMTLATEIRRELLDGRPREGIMRRLYDTHGDWSHDDDQYLYQLCHMYHPELFAPDIEKRLCVHLKDYPSRDWENDEDFRDGRCLGNSSILHIPDKAGHGYWKEWVRNEGRFPDLETDLLTVRYRRVGYGSVALDGNLGYEGRKVDLDAIADSDLIVSAHADSLLEITVNENVTVAGALNETAGTKNGCAGAEFLVDGRSLGKLDRAGSTTPFVDVPVGDHRLEIRATGSRECCHSLWIFRGKAGKIPKPETETTIVTCTRNQNAALERSLENWLRFDVPEIVVVDWRDESCENAASVVERFADPRVRLLETRHEYRLVPALAWNLACSMAGKTFLLRSAPGVLLHEDFFKRNRLSGREYRRSTEHACDDGILYVRKDVFHEIGGYNENMIALGHEDRDLGRRLEENAVRPLPIAEGTFSRDVATEPGHFLKGSGIAGTLCDAGEAAKVIDALREINVFLAETFPWRRDANATEWEKIAVSPNRFQVARNMRSRPEYSE